MRITGDSNPETLRNRAKQQKNANKKLANRLKKVNPRTLDEVVHYWHHRKFTEADCLECANCCKTISPIVISQDITRIARHLKTKPASLIAQYFVIDEDDDYVFRTQPCPFLGSENYCSIYEHRPRACRDFPLTDRTKFFQALDLSVKNTAICPVVFEIFQELRERF